MLKVLPARPGPSTSTVRTLAFNMVKQLYGCLHKLWLLDAGVLIIRALQFGVYIKAPDFGNCHVVWAKSSLFEALPL